MMGAGNGGNGWRRADSGGHALRQDKSTGTLRSQVAESIGDLEGPARASRPSVVGLFSENNALVGTFGSRAPR